MGDQIIDRETGQVAYTVMSNALVVGGVVGYRAAVRGGVPTIISLGDRAKVVSVRRMGSPTLHN